MVLHDRDSALLFDRNKDALEMHNLYGMSEDAAVRNRLRGKIEAWQRATNDRMALPAQS
jgi:hypothetical protein